MTYFGRITASVAPKVRGEIGPWPHGVFEKSSTFRSMILLSPVVKVAVVGSVR